MTNISSGIRLLDLSVKGKQGFKCGIYDISGTVGLTGLGVWEILCNLITDNLYNDANGNVLVIESINPIPWFKLKKNKYYKNEFDSRIDSISINNLIDLIVLLKNCNLEKYSLIIIDSFSTVYQNTINNLKTLSTENNDSIIKFYQSVKKMFHMMQKVCVDSDSVIFTTGSMAVFNQKFKVAGLADGDDEDGAGARDGADKDFAFINQQIFVPSISLKSDINLYYNNRIIIYRDWISETESNTLLSGLDYRDTNALEASILKLAVGKLRAMPHFNIITSSPTSVTSEQKTGFFLVDNNFQVIDIQNDEDTDEMDEIPDSQGY